MDDTHVIIVGAGPVGLMLAIELRLGGAQVIVLDRLAAASGQSRASTLHARTMELLDQRGLVDRLGSPVSRSRGHFAGLPVDLGGQDSPFAGVWMVPQPLLESVLEQAAVELGAQVRRGWEVLDIEAANGAATVLCAPPPPPDGSTGPDSSEFRLPVTLSAAWVVGCDGEESTVRRRSGIRLRGLPAQHRLLRADVTGIELPPRGFERLPNGLAIAGPLPSGATRLMVAAHDFPDLEVASASSDEAEAPGAATREPDFTLFAAAWKHVTGDDVSGATLLWINAFDDAAVLAESYRKGRVLLAGDAAHRQMPAGGQAINLGLREAVNLGWKLAAVATGRVGEALINTYHVERHPTAARVLDHVAAQSALLLRRDADSVRAVLSELLADPAIRDNLATAIGGLDDRYPGASGAHPLTGARLPPALAPRSSDARAAKATGRALLIDFAARASAPSQARTARLLDLAARDAGYCTEAVDVEVVNSALHSPDAALLSGADAVLLRPDEHVAWAGSL